MSSSPAFASNAGLNESPNFPLRVVDGLTLPPEYRKALRPGEEWKDGKTVSIRRQSGYCLKKLFLRRRGNRGSKPAHEIATVAERATYEDVFAVQSVAPEAWRRRNPVRLPEHAQRSGRAHHECHALVSGAIAAYVATGAVTPSRKPGDIRKSRPAPRPSVPKASKRLIGIG